MNGSCNTRSPDVCVRWEVTGHGVDTLAVGYRGPTLGPVLDHLSGLRDEGLMVAGPGGAYMASKKAGAPAALVWFPGHSLLVVEGRLAPIFTGTRENHALWPVPDLPYVREAAWQMWRDYLGVPQTGTPDDCRVTRLDLASEVTFDQGGGLPFLAALAALDVPRYKTNVWRNQGRTETVALCTPRRGIVHFRAYDKGVETGTESPGTRIRFERQKRFPKGDQMTPQTISERDCANLHRGGLQPFAEAGQGVDVGPPAVVAQRLADLWRTGVITRSEARRLIGHVYLASQSAPITESEGRRDRVQAARLRELGLAVAEWQVPESIPMGDVLAALGEVFAPC